MSAKAGPVTVVTSGGAVRGQHVDGVAGFRGIPFAAPPVGRLRSQPPQPAALGRDARGRRVRAPPPQMATGVPSHAPAATACHGAEGDVCEFVHTIGRDLRAWEPFETGMMLSDENLRHRPARFMTDENRRRLDELRADWDPEKRFVSWLARPPRAGWAREMRSRSDRAPRGGVARMYAEFIYAHNEREQPVRAVRAGIVNVL